MMSKSECSIGSKDGLGIKSLTQCALKGYATKLAHALKKMGFLFLFFVVSAFKATILVQKLPQFYEIL